MRLANKEPSREAAGVEEVVKEERTCCFLGMSQSLFSSSNLNIKVLGDFPLKKGMSY